VKDENISPAEIDENMGDLARQYKLTKDQFVRALGEAGIPEQSIREMEKAKIAWTALVRGRYFKQVRVSELRIDDMLERIEAGLGKPQYRLFEIFLTHRSGLRVNAGRRQNADLNINQGVTRDTGAAVSAAVGSGWRRRSRRATAPEISRDGADRADTASRQ
jgi:hypothetical protein